MSVWEKERTWGGDAAVGRVAVLALAGAADARSTSFIKDQFGRTTHDSRHTNATPRTTQEPMQRVKRRAQGGFAAGCEELRYRDSPRVRDSTACPPRWDEGGDRRRVRLRSVEESRRGARAVCAQLMRD